MLFRSGGFTGFCFNAKDCYSACAVIVDDANRPYIGGFTGDGGGLYCFWDMETSGQSAGVGSRVYGKTTLEMKTVKTFADVNWCISDFNGFDGEWIIKHEGQDYPKISRQFYYEDSISIPFAGDGNEANPYQIWTAEDFVALGHCFNAWEKHIRLMADLDLSGLLVHPIGNSIRRFKIGRASCRERV